LGIDIRSGKVAVVILAAGLGTRMKSDKAKVLHEILGKPMILYVFETAAMIAGENIVAVIGHQAEKVSEVISENYKSQFALQKEQKGTGHAVLCALPYIPDTAENVLILCGDVPLITADTLNALVHEHIKAERDISLLTVEVNDPKGYGRVIFDDNMNLSQIVEDADADEDQKRIRKINTGIYCIKRDILEDLLKKIKPDNAQAELYLTDIIEIAYKEGKSLGVWIGKNSDEFTGINSCQDLLRVEKLIMKNNQHL